MPQYEFLCLACKKKFSLVLSVSQNRKFKCPKCGSKWLEQRWAAVYAITSKKS